MGDFRRRLRSALDDLSVGLRSALGLEQPKPDLVEELLGARVADAPLRGRAPRRRRPRDPRRAHIAVVE